MAKYRRDNQMDNCGYSKKSKRQCVNQLDSEIKMVSGQLIVYQY